MTIPDSTARSDSALGGPDFMALPCGSGPREPNPQAVSALRASVPNAESAWLIERDNGGLEYACGRSWTRDYRDAIRFLSEADARNFAERAYKMVWTGERAAHFDWQDFTRIAEHRWG